LIAHFCATVFVIVLFDILHSTALGTLLLCYFPNELQQLLDEERLQFGLGPRVTTAQLIQEIAELEDSSDLVDAQCQTEVGALRVALERLGTQELELRQAKAQKDDWIRAVWLALGQQRQEEVQLLRLMQEDDLQTQELQRRTDDLVELQDLEQGLSRSADGASMLERHAASSPAFVEQRHNLQRASRGLALAAAEAEDRYCGCGFVSSLAVIFAVCSYLSKVWWQRFSQLCLALHLRCFIQVRWNS